MNISYLLSVLDLYLMREQNRILIVQIDNNTNLVKVNFSYSTDSSNKTFVKIDKNIFFNHLDEIKNKIQGNLHLTNEKIEKVNNQDVYSLDYNNQRKLVFVDFSSQDLSLIRSKITNSTEVLQITENITYEDEIVRNKSGKYALSMGFTSYLTLFISSIFLLDILMIALLIFQVYIK